MPLGTEVGHGPVDIVLDRDPQKISGVDSTPHFSAHVLLPNGWKDQDATWYGGRLSPGDIVLDGTTTPPNCARPPIFSPCLL